MKVVLFLLGALSLSQGLTPEEIELQAESKRVIANLLAKGVTPKSLDDNIIAMIDKILNQCEDPCYRETKDVNVHLLNETLQLTGVLKNFYLRGVSQHTIDSQFVLLPIKYTLGMHFDSVQVDSAYDIDGNIAQIIPIWGSSGDDGLILNATGVTVSVHVELTSRNLSLVAKSLDFNLEVESVYAYLDNFLGGLGDIIGPLLNDNLTDYIRRVLYYYKDDIRNFITTTVNKFLEGKSLQDLIDIINGLGTTTAAPKLLSSPTPSTVYTYV